MSDKIKAVILDWAGTSVDFGCFAPVDAFIKAFESFGVTPTMEETRAPMGLAKRVHIEKMLSGERLSALWEKARGRRFSDEDVSKIYAEFEPALFATLDNHADVIPGVPEALAEIRSMGIKIGSTTGYTRAMMDVVVPAAATAGYAPDAMVCPDDTGGKGRPYPYMLWKNLEILNVTAVRDVIKVGDTEADILEGLNAGCISVGVIKGSSMLGLSREEYESAPEKTLIKLHKETRRKYIVAGADFVLESIEDLPHLIKSCNGVA